jgi:hypothetical protein
VGSNVELGASGRQGVTIELDRRALLPGHTPTGVVEVYAARSFADAELADTVRVRD